MVSKYNLIYLKENRKTILSYLIIFLIVLNIFYSGKQINQNISNINEIEERYKESNKGNDLIKIDFIGIENINYNDTIAQNIRDIVFHVFNVIISFIITVMMSFRSQIQTIEDEIKRN